MAALTGLPCIFLLNLWYNSIPSAHATLEDLQGDVMGITCKVAYAL